MKGLFCFIAFAVSFSALAQTCLTDAIATTPTQDFVELQNDEVWHQTTDLVWKRCAEGQTWNGTTCAGEAIKYTWQQALTLAHTASKEDLLGWRLPNVKELASVTERLCVRPAINDSVFPQTPPDDFWTSTPSTRDPERAWVVAFFNSSHSIKQKDRFVYVRLVRTYIAEE
ncbi:DUF1566 domain-containing protein [Alteromonas pelagimontana]|uniref:DUF1566 domain-containing protein n=1 Tax=Alteromonas pelagimontana TaxID=1858656 RepID=A0A6M4MF30_9ALTE|nr:DUF1566 domain-containing protein [Alteromonas pelagimontana]QJR81712.1 DUF1566 domain-containing protein [Alteromonas pelagimontana]